MITIVGLGNSRDDLTQRGKRAIKDAKSLAVRTFNTVQTRRFKLKAVSMDDLFDRADSFFELDFLIADRVLELETKDGEVTYLVCGDGYTDGAVIELFRRGVKLNIIQGVSGLGQKEPSFSCLCYTASEIASVFPMFDTACDLVVNEISDRLLASEVKLGLLKSYSSEARAVFLSKGNATNIELCDLDRQKSYDHTTSVFIKGELGFEKRRYCMADLMRIMERLTAGDGCEWDKEQTHESIRINLIEEAYEAVDAIDSGDLDAMLEELGDCFLQSIFHADIARRGGEFDFFDMVHALAHKLVSRHTHIFGSDKASTSSEALVSWERAKAKEKSLSTFNMQLKAVPESFSALLKAQKFINKAKKSVCELDSDKIKAELTLRIERHDYGAAFMLLTALCELDGHYAEVELNQISNMFKARCMELKNIKGLTDLV